MTYALAEALQVAVYDRLNSDATLTGLVGGAIFDGTVPGPVADAPELHVTIGQERVRDGGDKTHRGAAHDFTVTVHSTQAGFRTAKTVAGAVCEALVDAPLNLSRGALIGLRFLFARADRGRGVRERRRVALRFRAVLEDV